MRKKVLTRAQFDRLFLEERSRAFTVTGVNRLDVLQHVLDRLTDAVAHGDTLADFAGNLDEVFSTAGLDPVSPWRAECLVGDTPVSGGVISAAHRRWYEGDVVEVVTALGRNFTATPNHPMLTRAGWKAAGELREGDDLVGYRGQQHVGPAGHADKEQPPTTIAEIFDSLSRSGAAEKILGRPLDFHGDGRDGYVDAVRANRELSFGDFAAIGEPSENYVFTKTALPGTRFCRACKHLVVITKRCGFCDRPVVRSGALESYADRIVARVKLFGEGISALAALVASGQFAVGQVSASPESGTAALQVGPPRYGRISAYASRPDDVVDPSLRGTDDGGDRHDALPRDVEFDRVRAVSRRFSSGHVYNLSTRHGYYLIAGLYTGNTIFRTGVQSAYGRGRYEQLVDPDIADEVYGFRYLTVGDDRVRDEHAALEGHVFSKDEAQWFPPLGFSCRCSTELVTTGEAAELGITNPLPVPEEARDAVSSDFVSPAVSYDYRPDLSGYHPTMVDAFIREGRERFGQ